MAKINKAELVEFFLMESEEHMETILNGLLILEKDPGNWSIIDEMFRSAHTIKGSAAMVGFIHISEVAHILENTLDDLRKGDFRIGNKSIGIMLESLGDFADLLRSKRDDFNHEELELYLEKFKEFDHLLKTNTDISDKDVGFEKKKIGHIVATSEDEMSSRREILKEADDNFTSPADNISIDSFIRIRLDRLDGLLDMVGELITNKNRQNERVRIIQSMSVDLEYAKARLQNLIAEFEDKYAFNVVEIMPETTSKHDQMIDGFLEGEFDRYDDINIFSRRLAEIGNDIVMIINDIMTSFFQFEEEIAQVNRITDNLQKGLTSIRLVPVDRLFNAAIRAARTSAASENKQIKILISGDKIELDKTLVDALTESFIHLVRNAVSHGVEFVEERKTSGKEIEGLLKLKAKREGSVVVFEIEDDGAGIDYGRIREKAIQLGLLDKYEADNIRTDKLINYLFKPGFSTKNKVGNISGRGVGLDVVKKRVESLNGHVYVETALGEGTKFVLTVPVTLLISDYLLLKENGQIFAIPIVSVQETFEINAENIKKIGEHYFYKLRDSVFEIHDLGLLLEQTNEAILNHNDVGVLVEGPRKKYILTVDSLEGRETSVTKKMGKFLEGLRHFAGASISPQGTVRLIVDPVRLMERKTGYTEYRRSIDSSEVSKGITYIPNSILVVDDSISVRKYLIKLLTQAGYRVDTAYDGVNALSYLDEKKYDLIMTDLEMPMMHGYELIENIRRIKGDTQTAIFVLTSRATEKHRMKAYDVGANDFLVKPFNDEEVLDKIKGVMLERA